MLERMTLTKELNANYFDDKLSDEYLLAALTPPMASIEYDYERLELLGWYFLTFSQLALNTSITCAGDTFLKYITATYLYVVMPGQREGKLNSARGQIVSNKSLHAGALKFGLPPYIQSKPLVTKIWQPFVQDSSKCEDQRDVPGGEKPAQHRAGGKRKRQLDEQSVQWLGDKVS